MGAWHGTYANLLRSRFSALVAYAEALLDDRVAARELAQQASVEVFSRRKAPRDTHTAEMAAREWMAARALEDGADANHVATVLIAIDGHSPEAVKAILKKDTPDPLPEVDPRDIAALRQRFAETAAVYSTPSGGVNTVMAPARQRHRSALTGAAVGTVAAVGVVAAAGWFGLNHLPDLTSAADAPTASASATATGLQVMWDPEPDYNAAMAGFHFPQCGEKFSPEAQPVGGILPKPKVGDIEEDGDNAQWVLVSDAFVSDDGKQTALLAQPYSIVGTRDGVVIYAEEQHYFGMDLYNANSPSDGSGVGFSPSSMCAAREDGQKLGDSMAGLSDEDQQKMWDEYNKKWSKFEPGTYEIYMVTPIVFGQQLALAQTFALDGIQDMTSLSQDISWTPLADDPRVSPYCIGSKDTGDFQCTPPPSVLKEVLTRQVDPALVDDTAPGVGISAPVEVTVD